MFTLLFPLAVFFFFFFFQLIEEVSSGQHMTKTDFIREAVLEKLEDMYDLSRADDTYKEWVGAGKKTLSHDEMMKRYG